ncbi:VOC family protein [Candidatus Parcubacteria bacterium]|nr:VOC family protein [Candidatus Parcubacteria bacterium]
MQSKLNPYISFDGNAKEAMEFYKNAFGGKLAMSTFKEGGAPLNETNPDGIMHAMLVADNDMILMASDTPGTDYKPGNNISVSLSGDNEAELKGYWDKLSEGAKVTMPLEKAPWGDMFGMLTDKFGIHWLVNIAGKKA